MTDDHLEGALTVRQLIESLQALPQDLRVGYLWDGCVRSEAAIAYEAKGGFVVIANAGGVVYDDEDRPVGSPSPKQEQYWATPNIPRDE